MIPLWRRTELDQVQELTVCRYYCFILERKINILCTGWGQFLGQYLNIPVVNQAVGGESARSFADQDKLVDLMFQPRSHDLTYLPQIHHSC